MCVPTGGWSCIIAIWHIIYANNMVLEIGILISAFKSSPGFLWMQVDEISIEKTYRLPGRLL